MNLFPNSNNSYTIDLLIKAQKSLKRHNTTVHAFAGLAQELPFKSNRFDICFCSGLLHHLRGQPGTVNAVIKEMHRITKPGGFVVALEPNFLYPTGIFMNLMSIFAENFYSQKLGFVPYERALSTFTLSKLFKKEGIPKMYYMGTTFLSNRLPFFLQRDFIIPRIDPLLKIHLFNHFSWWNLIIGRKICSEN